MNFHQLHVIEPIIRALTDAGYSSATDIQKNAIPPILAGQDVLGSAQTGSGKTAAFAIPILQRLQTEKRNNAIRTLILAPTRKLAIQIQSNFEEYGKYLSFNCVSIFGGVPQGKQIHALRRQTDVLVATPGRLLDLMNQGYINLSQIEILVLDEADRMLDMGFVNDVKRILTRVPEKRQTLLFSATLPDSIMKLAHSILRNPVKVAINPLTSTAEKIEQSVYFVEKKEKTDLLIQILKDKTIPRSLVFTRTKHGANRLVTQLSRTGIFAAAIHGNKSQQSRQKALEDFKNSKIRVLVATDIASRGVDIEELPHVINYELPNVPETYIHRIGRTGRAGKNGVAISFCGSDERNELNDIQKLIGFRIPVKG